MTDAELIEMLDRGEVPSGFDHATHVRAGYAYLSRMEFGPTVERMGGALRRIGGARYHATITVAFLALIAERLARDGDPGDWRDFAKANPDLLDARLLQRYYAPETLRTATARQVFVLEPIRRGDR